MCVGWWICVGAVGNVWKMKEWKVADIQVRGDGQKHEQVGIASR